MFWNEWKIKFAIFIFWVINDFVHNFQVFLTEFLGICFLGKDAQFSELDFCIHEFFLGDS